jgi:hypothetical protein
MGIQAFPGLENIPLLVKASTTTITFANTFEGKAVWVKVGGMLHKPANTTTTLSTGTVGFSGLDIGALAANTLYYVYAVKNSTGLGANSWSYWVYGLERNRKI